MQAPPSSSPRDPDFSREVLAELYRLRPRRLATARVLAALLGVAGAHRFYCGRPWSGALMLLTGGGGLLWWLRDLFCLRALVDEANEEERARHARGYPPRGLEFLPPRQELRLDQPPAWASRRAGRGRIVGSAILLVVIGTALGALTGVTGDYEATIVLGLFIAVSLVAARARALVHVPVLGALLRWVHRLRLFYHAVDPGSLTALALRPLVGVFFAPWRPRARAEVRLHLELGGSIVLMFALADAIELARSGGLVDGLSLLLAQAARTLVCTYLLVAPASAILTTQLLLARRDVVVWVLSALTLASLYAGLSLVV